MALRKKGKHKRWADQKADRRRRPKFSANKKSIQEMAR